MIAKLAGTNTNDTLRLSGDTVYAAVKYPTPYMCRGITPETAKDESKISQAIAKMLEEDLTLPDSAPQPEKLIYSRMEPRITDSRLVGDKLVYRGNGNLHVLCRSEEGKLYSWDFPMPFSQKF